MEKEFIPYEQALALKDLGFEETCFVFWTSKPKYKGNTIQLCITDGIHGYHPSSILFGLDFLREGEVLAPTFSQAFRWFREKYGIKNYVYEVLEERFVFVTYTNPLDYKMSSTYHTTYEEAELECLIRLIEITKSC